MSQKIPVEEFKLRYSLVGLTDFFDESTYECMTKKARFVDPKYGEYWIKPKVVIQKKSGHRARIVEKIFATKTKNNTFQKPKEKPPKISKKPTCETIEKRVQEINPNISIVKDTFISKSKKCTFYEEGHGFFTGKASSFFSGKTKGFPRRGERIKEAWENTYANNQELINARTEKMNNTMKEIYGEKGYKADVIVNKYKATMLKIHGTEHPMHSPEIALKTAKSQNHVSLIPHWQTNAELVCVASYEAIVVLYFNKNQIPFEFQSKTFNLPTLNTTYRPDFYLPDQDLWIETKGYFREDAKAKWELFHSQYPNSELWTRDVLFSKGLLKKDGQAANKKELQQYRYIKPIKEVA